ncbi:MAG: hypothetical protein GXY53_00345 [Desulfobulbus sp.]|nr:hypothetical protein [Desulfobulbus sp.]
MKQVETVSPYRVIERGCFLYDDAMPDNPAYQKVWKSSTLYQDTLQTNVVMSADSPAGGNTLQAGWRMWKRVLAALFGVRG